jgi:hypothetical protein
MSTSRSEVRRVIPWLLLGSLVLPLPALADGTDDFTGPKDSSKWGEDVALAEGVLTQTAGRLEYTCANPLSDGDTYRPWVMTRFPVDRDWEIRVDTFNGTVPSQAFEVNSAGLVLLHPTLAESEINVELYASSLGAADSVRKGFDADLDTGGVRIGDVDSGGLTNGAVRVVYVGATRVATCYYDLDVSDGYQWTELASFGLAGAGGGSANTDWALASTDQLTLCLYGYSGGMTVTSGQIYLDNFVETGGVGSTGGPTPVPTGSFGFGFPKGHPLLAAILSLSGNYRGVTPTASARSYSIDVAQDESGKLAAMGTMDGVLDGDGSPEISGIGGTVRTVNDEPTVRLQGDFDGTRDGESATLGFKASGTAEIVDIGEGASGLAATATYKSKVGGVPFSGRNLPIQVPTPIGTEENLRQDWSIRLDLVERTIKNKARIAASAELTLPTGETIHFPEKVVKYSTSKGYRLKFRRGTNVTQNPPAVDPKPKITIKGLTFAQQGNAWQPTAGEIAYEFLGQKGAGSLLEFVR